MRLLVMLCGIFFIANSAMAEVNMREIRLPKPSLKGGVSLEETISKRRSVRRYNQTELTTEQIGQLLWAAQGVTDSKGLRAAPSAGALYPLEIYVVMNDELFYYVPVQHKLIFRKKDKGLREKLAKAAFGQSFIEEAPVSIVISGVYERVTARYGERGVRYTYIEVGHAAENVHLEAVALGLASVPVGAFNDNAVSQLLELKEEETPLYIIPVGYAR